MAAAGTASKDQFRIRLSHRYELEGWFFIIDTYDLFTNICYSSFAEISIIGWQLNHSAEKSGSGC